MRHNVAPVNLPDHGRIPTYRKCLCVVVTVKKLGIPNSKAVLCGFALLLTILTPAFAYQPRLAPVCKLKQMATGESVDWKQLRGKVLYVDFWASWCAPCAQSFPFLNQLNQDFSGKGLKVLGINVDERPEDATVFLARHLPSFNIVTDVDRDCPRQFDVAGMPAAYLIDREGVIRFMHLGFRPSTGQQIRTQVEQLLNEPSSKP